MSDVRVCTARRLPSGMHGEAHFLAVCMNPSNRSSGPGLARASVASQKKWRVGSVITVSFFGGTDTQRGRVQPYFHRWEQYANLKFRFIDNPVFSDVRVAFNPNDGSWSYVGTDCLLVAKDEPTVNFGWLEDQTEEEEYRRVVLHECGHVLGFDHEDQQPAAAIQWDVPKVLAYYEGPPNFWSADDVFTQVINKINDPSEQHTVFDPLSIMAYFVPAEMTLNHVAVPMNTDLSTMDRVFAGEMYPGVMQPPPPAPPELPSLPLGGPQTMCDLSPDVPLTDYRFNVPAFGKYRIWSSQLSAPLLLFHPADLNTPVVSGVQQFTSDIPPGQYVLRVSSIDKATDRRVRLHARALP
jgi:serralysin